MALIDMSAEEALERAQNERSVEALYDLGILYSTGQGVDMNYIEAHKWFNLAAMRGNASARDWRSELAKEMTSEDIAEAQKQAREWLQAH